MVLLAISLPSLGQEDSIQTKKLDEIVIVGSRYERSIAESNRTIEVISQSEIESSPYLNVAELLSQQKGIYVVGQTQTPGSNQSLFLRGTNSNNVNILIDGIRINDPTTPGGALDLSELSLVNVERVEILKGSQGVLYGSMGIGGVINIVTKEPETGFSGSVSSQAGTFGKKTSSFREEVLVNYRLENGMYFSGGVLAEQVSGLDATIDTTTSSFSTNDRDGFSKIDWILKTGINTEKFNVFASYKNVSQESEIDRGAFDDDDNATLELDRDLINYQAEYDFGDSKLKFIGGWTKVMRVVENDSSVIDPSGQTDQSYSLNEFEGISPTNELQWSKQANAYSLVAGIGRFEEKMDFYSYFFSNQFGRFELESDYDSLDLSASTNYLFSQLTIYGQEVVKNARVTLGGRYTLHSNFGNQFSYEISPGFVWEKLRVYAVLASGFKNPSLTQLFDPNMGSLTNRGNEGLKPETSLSLELGSDWSPFIGLDLSASVFFIQLNNAIEYVYLWDQNVAVNALTFNEFLGDTYLNIGDQVNTGYEIGISYKTGKFGFATDYSYVDGAVDFSPDKIDTDKTQNSYVQLFSNGAFLINENEESGLIRRPSHLLQAKINYQPVIDLIVGIRYQFVSARNDSFYDPSLGPFGALNTLEVSDYHLVDFNAQYQLNGLNFSMQIENLFNQNFNEIQGFATRGRGYYLKVGFKF